MHTYLILLRGINVGGKNKVSMQTLKESLESLGFSDVSTYINSGNVILRSDKKSDEIQQIIEEVLPKQFTLDSEVIKVLVLTQAQLQSVVDNKPKGFGDHPETYHSDAIFLMDINSEEAFSVFEPREGVDKIWQGPLVIYSQRLSAERTKSRLSKIMLSPLYKSMAIRSWNTTEKLLQLINANSTNS